MLSLADEPGICNHFFFLFLFFVLQSAQNGETLSQLVLLECRSRTEPRRKTIRCPPQKKRKKKKAEKKSPHKCSSVDYHLCQVSTCTCSEGFVAFSRKTELLRACRLHREKKCHWSGLKCDVAQHSLYSAATLCDASCEAIIYDSSKKRCGKCWGCFLVGLLSVWAQAPPTG